jgi:hypothetical protein
MCRVSLGVTTLLTMSTQQASINNSLPPVAYTKEKKQHNQVNFSNGSQVSFYLIIFYNNYSTSGLHQGKKTQHKSH